MTTRTCTLSFSRLRAAMFAEIRKIPANSGIWCDSFNHHCYAQHTLWHITPEVVTAFHFNLTKSQDLNILRDLSSPYLEELGIVVAITLQDGAQKLMEGAALPLLHFTYQSLNLLRNMLKTEWVDDSLLCVFSGYAFLHCFQHTSNLEDMYKRLSFPFKNESRYRYRFEEELLSSENADNLAATIQRLMQLTTRSSHDSTAQMTKHYFAALRGLWQRNCTTAVVGRETSADVVAHLKMVNDKFSLLPIPSNVVTKNYALPSLAVYTHFLQQNPDAPSECFNFAFDYELSMTCQTLRNPKTKIFIILERLSVGKVYEAGTFSFWCGVTVKKVIFPKIQINKRLLTELNQYLN